MSNNVKNANQRLKILYLYKIFLEMTDEEHYITMPEIIRQLESYGISAGRKALYEDIEALKAFGLDIVSLKGRVSGYYVAGRDFELPELKLLADAVCSSRFLTEKKIGRIIEKNRKACKRPRGEADTQAGVYCKPRKVYERAYLHKRRCDTQSDFKWKTNRL